jgi:prevent-host-death family protein
MRVTTIGVRELKSRLSEYLRRVKAGETIVITDRGRTVGRIVPAAAPLDDRLQSLLAAGLAEWNGQPLPPARPAAALPGRPTLADLLIENRA